MMASSVFRGTEARGSVKQSQSRLLHSEILSQKSKTKTNQRKKETACKVKTRETLGNLPHLEIYICKQNQ